MSLSMLTTVAQVRALVAEITEMARVFAASETDENRLPSGISEFPCAVIYPGPDLGSGYILSAGQHRHTYEVIIDVFEAGADIGERAASVLPMVDRIIEKFSGNVTLGNRVNSCIYQGQGGFTGMTYGGGEYTGYRITLRVSEQASATPAIGS